jgi:Domain of unknown function (DUF4430)
VPTCAHAVRLAALAALAAGVAGCGFGSGGESEGEATLTVTRDYGSEVLVEATEEDPPESETVIRFLDREADITTRYGGGFVQSIEGVSGELRDGRNFDWFFYVNGIESSTGSAEVEVRGGDRIWWDHRDWTDAMRVPAVVGSWPEPFLQASADGEPTPVGLECEAAPGECEEARDHFADEGLTISDEGEDAAGREPAPRMLVGPWESLRADPAAAQLDDGPATSGVFARFERDPQGGHELLALDERGQVALRLGVDAGLVAAVRDGDDPPTWVVTGGDERGVAAALSLLTSRDLSNRYAVAAVPGGAPVSLPALDDR